MNYTFRSKKLFDPKSKGQHRLSRSKIELFLECPRCFYIDQKFGVKRPDFPAFTLNSAVDTLLKKEFDIHRVKKDAHPLMKEYGVDAVPFSHEDLEKWRHTFTGIQFFHRQTNFLVFGAIDDLWINSKDELHIVDYKATSKTNKPDLEGEYQQSYKRQMEIYQWLFRQNGFKVSNFGYFVYVNGKRDKKAFDARLEFDVFLIPYEGNDKWIEDAIINARKCLVGELPTPNDSCAYCNYRKDAANTTAAAMKIQKKSTIKKNKIDNATLF